MFGFLRKKKKKEKEQKITQEPVVETTQEEPKQETPVKVARKRKPVNHITKHKDGGWQLKKEGAQRALRKFDTQKEAIAFAKEYETEKGVGYIIHKTDGTTRKKKY